MKWKNTLKIRTTADLWTLFITGTRENLEDCLSYLIWFKKTLLLANRKSKPQNRTSWDEGTTGWDEKKTGCETKVASCDKTGALGKITEVHKEPRTILRLEWFLSQPLHPRTSHIAHGKTEGSDRRWTAPVKAMLIKNYKFLEGN